MTKFEEELFNKVPCKFELTTEAEYKKTTLINHFKNWHSDDEYQELFEQNAELTRENNIVNQINSKLESQIIDLKSQQQALPVVPECVGKWLDSNNLASLLDEWYCHHEDMSSHIREYFERLPYKGPNNLSEMENNIVTFITRAKLGGYKLEKPQLFYIGLPNVYGLSDSVFVSKVEYGTILEFTKGKDYALALTEQEIKSIDERYWQFAVPVEDGE